MAEDDRLPDPPSAGVADVVHAVGAAAGGMVPIAGPAIERAIDMAFGPPIARRQQVWLRDHLTPTVHRLEEHAGRSAEELAQDDTFLSASLLASQAAIGTHLVDKLRMFKAVLVHHALDPARGDVVTLRYLQWAQELEPDHVAVLTYARDPRGWYDEHGLAAESYYSAARRAPLDQAQILPADILDMVLFDLDARRLASTGMLSGMVTSNSVWNAWIAPLGTEWLRWVTAFDLPDDLAEVVQI